MVISELLCYRNVPRIECSLIVHKQLLANGRYRSQPFVPLFDAILRVNYIYTSFDIR